jgi:hypothetical protein
MDGRCAHHRYSEAGSSHRARALVKTLEVYFADTLGAPLWRHALAEPIPRRDEQPRTTSGC